MSAIKLTLQARIRDVLLRATQDGMHDRHTLASALAASLEAPAHCEIIEDGVHLRIRATDGRTKESVVAHLVTTLDPARFDFGMDAKTTLVWAARLEAGDELPGIEALTRTLWSMAPERRPAEIIVHSIGLRITATTETHPWALGLTRLYARSTKCRCHICGSVIRSPHFMYDRLCVACGDQNLHRRLFAAPLDGRVALVTGGRIKVGYATALRLLRCGAEVVVTTRFPGDALARYSQERDASVWLDRLKIVGADFRRLPELRRLISYLREQKPHLEILINNAAQTVRMPDTQFALLTKAEPAKRALAGDSVHLLDAKTWREPSGAAKQYDASVTLDRVDPTHDAFVSADADNGWNRGLGDTPAHEIFEAHVVNAVAPAILCAELKTMLERSPFRHRHIVNVGAPEGVFDTRKSGWHVHTNMAKAALHMLTRSIARDYAAAGILVNSVDPGWVSDQMPRKTQRAGEDASLRLPLTFDDASARICEPVFEAETGNPFAGQMRKDYKSASW